MATISTLRNKQKEIIGFQSNLGQDENGKSRRKYHKTYEEAKAYIRLKTAHQIGSDEFYNQRHKLIAAMQRAAELGTTISDALEFYAKHGARMTNPTLAELVVQLIGEKRQAGKSKGYLEDMTVKYGTFQSAIGGDVKVSEITPKQIMDYIYVQHSALHNNTKRNHIRMLSLLFNYAVKKRCTSFNPVSEITKPNSLKAAPKIITPEDFAKLLDRCLRKKWHDRLAVFLLNGFCGCRVEEASKLSWSHISYEKGKVTIPETVAKLGAHRIVPIPPNAMVWFEAIRDNRRTGLIIPSNWKNLLRSAVRFAHINCPKNAIRHSYCSYALAVGWSLADVVAWMGHNGSPAMIHRKYRELVEDDAARKWWQIRPSTT